MKTLTKAGMLLGAGLGGFADGIVLHQILGWHHLICTTETCQPETIEALKRQNTQDGFFHLAMWALTLAGLVLFFRAARRDTASLSSRAFTGALLAGWGLFDLLEGLLNHHVLGLHHVRPGHQHESLFDLLFLGSGLVLIGIGAGCLRSTGKDPARESPAA